MQNCSLTVQLCSPRLRLCSFWYSWIQLHELSFWRWSGQIGGWSATFSVWTRCNATQLQAMTCTLVNVHHGIVKPSLCPFTWRVLHRCDAHPLIALWMSVICRAECEWDSESNRCIFVWLPNKRSFYSPGWWVVLSLNKGRQSAHPISPSSSAAAEKFQTNGGGMVWYNRRQIGRCDSFRLDWIACSGWIGFVIAIGKPKTVTYRKFTYARAIWEFLSTSTTRSTNSFYYKLQ